MFDSCQLTITFVGYHNVEVLANNSKSPEYVCSGAQLVSELGT